VRLHAVGRRVMLLLAAIASARAATLEDVLARMDVAAKQFKSYSAMAKVIDYTKLFDDRYEQNGSFRLRRLKDGVSGIMDLSAGRDPKVFHFNGPVLEIYLPKAGETQVLKVGQYTSMVNRMLLVGFSVTREDLRKDYAIALGGAEKIGAMPVTGIVLTPKSREALKRIVKIELWIPDGTGYAIRQKIDQPKEDYHLVEYSNLQVNPPLPDSAFELIVPAGTKQVIEN
jgi:outer membrane lipoprotein-sorting protein